MNADEIRAAVDRGETVHWSHHGYVVEKWNIGTHFESYSIVCLHNQHAIGLTWQDGQTLNGANDDFYIAGHKSGPREE